jgi:RNA polymerase sigma-70 factor (ECF subfamily)
MDAAAEDAYDDMFRREHTAMVRTAYLIVGDLEVARELAQEGFVQLYLHWSKVSHYDRPGAWLRRVVVRLAVKSRDRSSRMRSVSLVTTGSGDEDGYRGGVPEGVLCAVDTEVDRTMVGEDVMSALAALSPHQRAAAVLFYFVDASVAEIADYLGCSPATAKVHLHRARLHLADALGEPEPDEVPVGVVSMNDGGDAA